MQCPAKQPPGLARATACCHCVCAVPGSTVMKHAPSPLCRPAPGHEAALLPNSDPAESSKHALDNLRAPLGTYPGPLYIFILGSWQSRSRSQGVGLFPGGICGPMRQDRHALIVLHAQCTCGLLPSQKAQRGRMDGSVGAVPAWSLGHLISVPCFTAGSLQDPGQATRAWVYECGEGSWRWCLSGLNADGA